MIHYHVYADANIFLDFYRFSDDDLGQLEKIAAQIDGEQISLYLPELTAEEYFRNRDKIVLEQLAQLNGMKLQTGIPVFIRESEAAKDFSEALKDAFSKRKKLLEEAQTNAAGRTFRADKLIESIFAKARRIETTNIIVEKAQLRVQLGNPPGKPNSLGDRINWEILLESVPENENLYLITRDNDFISQFDSATMNMFLIEEWKKIKNGDVHLFSGIKSFAKTVDDTLEFSVDAQKVEAIEELAASFAFSTTHSAIAKLSQWQGMFTDQEKDRLLQIALSNNQVGGIMSDSDLEEFYTEVRKGMPFFDNPLVEEFDTEFPDIDPVPF